jgi:hypothetical protein
LRTTASNKHAAGGGRGTCTASGGGTGTVVDDVVDVMVGCYKLTVMDQNSTIKKDLTQNLGTEGNNQSRYFDLTRISFLW